MLREELGIEPDQALVGLHGSILRHDPHWIIGPPTAGACVVPVAASTERSGVALPDAGVVGPDGRVYPVRDGLSLGRQSGSATQIDDPRVSRTYAAIRATATGYVLADLQSTTGTFVNGDLLLEPMRLTGGEPAPHRVLRLGLPPASAVTAGIRAGGVAVCRMSALAVWCREQERGGYGGRRFSGGRGHHQQRG
jgi:hypothetical protein